MISIVGVLKRSLPILKVNCGFMSRSSWCRASSTRYKFIVSLKVKPRFVSNISQAVGGRYMYGIVESMNVKTGDDNRVEEDPLANVDVMD